MGLHLRIGSSVGFEELERNQMQAPEVPKESDKHLHGVKRKGIGGERGISVTLGIRKHFASKEQLGLNSKRRTQWVYPCKDIEIRVERGDVGILRTGLTKAWPPRPSFYRYEN